MRFDLFVAFQEESIATGDRQPESMYLFRGGQVRPCDAGVHTALVLFGGLGHGAPSATGGSALCLSGTGAWQGNAADDGKSIEHPPLEFQ